jgi:hypothetical protein
MLSKERIVHGKVNHSKAGKVLENQKIMLISSECRKEGVYL